MKVIQQINKWFDAVVENHQDRVYIKDHQRGWDTAVEFFNSRRRQLEIAQLHLNAATNEMLLKYCDKDDAFSQGIREACKAHDNNEKLT